MGDVTWMGSTEAARHSVPVGCMHSFNRAPMLEIGGPHGELHIFQGKTQA